MGTWDASVFGNDDAADWAADLAEGNTASPVREALEEITQAPADEYLEAGPAAEALAAAEVVAAAAGRPAPVNSYNENVLAWAAQRPSLVELTPLARQAIERVQGTESELADHWAEAGDADRGEWSTTLQDLLTRLS
jgi:hypothetical protein